MRLCFWLMPNESKHERITWKAIALFHDSNGFLLVVVYVLLPSKLDPTLRLDVMSPRISCLTGLKHACCYQVAGKYERNYKK